MDPIIPELKIICKNNQYKYFKQAIISNCKTITQTTLKIETSSNIKWLITKTKLLKNILGAKDLTNLQTEIIQFIRKENSQLCNFLIESNNFNHTDLIYLLLLEELKTPNRKYILNTIGNINLDNISYIQVCTINEGLLNTTSKKPGWENILSLDTINQLFYDKKFPESDTAEVKLHHMFTYDICNNILKNSEFNQDIFNYKYKTFHRVCMSNMYRTNNYDMIYDFFINIKKHNKPCVIKEYMNKYKYININYNIVGLYNKIDNEYIQMSYINDAIKGISYIEYLNDTNKKQFNTYLNNNIEKLDISIIHKLVKTNVLDKDNRKKARTIVKQTI